LRHRFDFFLKYFPLWYSLRKADKVVAVSNYVKDFLKRNIGKDEKDIFVAYPMINMILLRSLRWLSLLCLILLFSGNK